MDVLAARARRWDRLLSLGLAAACGLLWFGLTLPILQTSQFYIFSDAISLAGIVRELWVEREFFLSVVIVVFSIGFPAVKLIAAFLLWRLTPLGSPYFARALALIDFLGKWSLADVLIVALAVIVIKSSGLMDATVGIGLYRFAASIALTAVVVSRLKHLAQRSALAAA